MSYSKGNSYEEILGRCLSDERLTDVDKRAGSVIYDALAPLCLELAEAYIKMDIMNDQTYLLTATGENLDKRVYDYGIMRLQATKAEKIGVFKCYEKDGDGNYVLDDEGNKILIDMDVPIGSRFSIPNNSDIIFVMKEKRDVGGSIKNVLECESPGSGANTYNGTILPITPILNLVKAEVGNAIVPGSDTETDEELRLRTQNYLTDIAFGGNISDYRNKIEQEDGYGAAKVFPSYVDPNQAVLSVKAINNAPISTEILEDIVEAIFTVEEVGSVKKLDFNGGVKISVIGDDYNPLTPEAVANLQNIIDPDSEGSGYGIAPIGHYVTITTPEEAPLTVDLTIEVKPDTTVEAETDGVIEAIQDYVITARKGFALPYNYSVIEISVSQIITSINNHCPNVINITDVVLNKDTPSETTNKITYVDTVEHQYIPAIPTADDITITEEI